MASGGDYESISMPYNEYKENTQKNSIIKEVGNNSNHLNKIKNFSKKSNNTFIIICLIIFILTLIYFLLESILLLIDKENILGFKFQKNTFRALLIIFGFIIVSLNIIKIIMALLPEFHTSCKDITLHVIFFSVYFLILMIDITHQINGIIALISYLEASSGFGVILFFNRCFFQLYIFCDFYYIYNFKNNKIINKAK